MLDLRLWVSLPLIDMRLYLYVSACACVCPVCVCVCASVSARVSGCAWEPKKTGRPAGDLKTSKFSALRAVREACKFHSYFY